MSGRYEELFFKGAESWICDYYTLSIRYVAYFLDDRWQLGNASIQLTPLPLDNASSFVVEFDQLRAGLSISNDVPRHEILEILRAASRGELIVEARRFKFHDLCHAYSEMIHPDRWFANLHLQVSSNSIFALDAVTITNLDNQLRRGAIPFDGLNDLIGFLGLTSNQPDRPCINIWANPPVQLMHQESSVEKGKVKLVLHAHPKLNLGVITVALRGVPGDDVQTSRIQVADRIQWAEIEDGRQRGTVELEMPEVDSVLVMLMHGEAMVRRHWLIDPARARNNRFVAFQHFDTDLKMLRKWIIDPPKNAADNFEKGIAALLFLMGFVPTLSLEDDAPDILVATPGGRLVLVECTLRFTDFATKVNKLARRRSTLSRVLNEAGHYSGIECILVCAISKADTVNEHAMLQQNRVILMTREEIESELVTVRLPTDPDQYLLNAIGNLERTGELFAAAGHEISKLSSAR